MWNKFSVKLVDCIQYKTYFRGEFKIMNMLVILEKKDNKYVGFSLLILTLMTFSIANQLYQYILVVKLCRVY